LEAGGIAVVGHGVELLGVVDGVVIDPGAVAFGEVWLFCVPGVVVCVPALGVELGAVEPLGVVLVWASAKLPAKIRPPITINFVFIKLPPYKRSSLRLGN